MNNVIYDYQIFSWQPFGGVSRYFCEIASRINRNNTWRARVVAPLHFNRYLAASKVTTIGWYAPIPHPLLGNIHRWANALLAPALMTMGRTSLIHRTYYQKRPNAGRAPVVLTVYDMIHERFPQYFAADDPTRLQKRASVNAADHILCISHNTARDLTEILGVSREKITVTQLGYSKVFSDVRLSLGSPLEPMSRPYLLYVGGRAGYKNFDRLFEAYTASAHLSNNFDLLAFGGSPFTKTELERIKESGVRSNAIRRMSGDDRTLARCYAGARAFVYPSEYEGFGMPPLEAMSCGCPVVCSNGSSISEVVGTAGEYFDPTRTDSIRAALERIAFDDSRRRDLIAAGEARRRLFSWDKCVDETICAYNKLV